MSFLRISLEILGPVKGSTRKLLRTDSRKLRISPAAICCHSVIVVVVVVRSVVVVGAEYVEQLLFIGDDVALHQFHARTKQSLERGHVQH